MRNMKAEEFVNDWQYEKAKRQERKQDRRSRDRRKTGRGVWQAIPADE